MRLHVVKAVFKRNVSSYFSGMLGYLFIVVFVVVGAFLAFNDQFFASNLANLDQLSLRFPLLLLFIIPAITMTSWSDERKLGTDELLFTLPAKDYEILLGKYLAVLAVYTVALGFSLTHVLVLALLGNPDWGLLMTTYFGYWLAGAAVLAAGMFASSLTSSPTVAFVLGACICAIPIFIDSIPGVQNFVRDVFNINEQLSVAGQLKSFSSGRVTLTSLCYFVGLAVFFLYLNSLVISRRHWAGRKDSGSLLGQYSLRVLCLAVGVLSLSFAFAVRGSTIDATTERLHTLSQTTLDVIKNVPNDKPITIQAFISPDVPQSFVAIRKDLINKLNEYDQRGGSRIQLRIVDVEPFSRAAEQAEALGINARPMQSESAGRLSRSDIYLGVVLTSGFDTVTVPFFDRGTPIEYELTRSIGTISQAKRIVLGVLETDAQVTGGVDMMTFRQVPEWEIIRELRKQYTVKSIAPDDLAAAEIDVLLAVLPSSLTENQVGPLVDYIESGKPVLIFDDPVPVWGNSMTGTGITLAPLEPKPSMGGGMMGMQQQSEPKADGGRATKIQQALGIEWRAQDSLFDIYNPYPAFRSTSPKELMFLDGKESANQNEPVTSGLQELITFAPGHISGRDDSAQVTWLIRSRSGSSGLNDWNKITVPGMFGGRQYAIGQSGAYQYQTTDESYVIAAKINGKDGRKTNAIFVADVDLLHDTMFQVWQQQWQNLNIDNVLFVLNCVDVLSGQDQFLELRKRRAAHRTLKRLETRKKAFEESLQNQITAADLAADEELQQAQNRLTAILEDLKKELQAGSVDASAVSVRLENATAAEQRKLTQREKEIEREKQETVTKVRREMERDIRRIEHGVWYWAVFIPPLPAILLGIGVFFSRLIDERKGISSDRRRTV